MKLKPLIKTHWLASQNPMTVPLNGLHRVVFHFPRSLVNGEFIGAEQARISLPSLHSPWANSPIKDLANSLEFHSDGGVFYPLRESLAQTYPPFLNPSFYRRDPTCHWNRLSEIRGQDLLKPLKLSDFLKRQDETQKTWIILLEILAWAFQRQRQIGDLEVVYTEDAFSLGSEGRSGFILEDLEILRAHPLRATVMAESHFPGAARISLWEGIETQASPRVLRLFSDVALAGWEGHYPQQVEPAPHEYSLLQSLSLQNEEEVVWRRRWVAQESNPEEILSLIKTVERLCGRDHLHFVEHVPVSGKDLHPFLKIREEEGRLQASVSFEILPLKLYQQNFPRSLAAVLAPFAGGMDTFFGLERKSIASRQLVHRAHDMALLRHQGVTLFCLLELMNWKLKRPLSSGEIIEFVDDLETPEADRQFTQMMNFLTGAIPGLLGKPEMSFESMFSTRVKELFFEFVERLFHLLQEDRELIFADGKVGEIKNVHKRTLPILRFFLLLMIESTRGRFLTRSQSTISDQAKSQIRQWTEPYRQSFLPLEPQWIDLGLPDKYLITLLFELLDEDVKIELNGMSFFEQGNPFEFIFKINNAEMAEAADWFDLDPQIFFNGQRVAPEEVKLNFTPGKIGFIEFRGQVYRIDKTQVPTLKSLQRFWNYLKKSSDNEKRNSFGEKIYRLQRSQALELLLLKFQGVRIEAGGQWKKVFDYFDNGLGTEKIRLPSLIQQQLLPHQQQGTQWLHDLYELRLGAILADEMGLGKTFQVLAFLASLQQRRELKKCLVVVPTSLVYNWLDEKKKFAPDLPLAIFQSTQKEELQRRCQSEEPLVMVATYGLLLENAEFFQNIDWNVLAFDEAQNLKNILSQRSITARKLKADFKICLTGTPMENHYLEFYSLCDLVVPGCLGDADAFRRRYDGEEVRSECLRELRLISKPLLLRRTKEQVKLSLPTKTVQRVSLPFGPRQKEIYKKMALAFSRQVDELIQTQGEKKAHIAMFTALMRLRQICSDPSAVPGVVFDEQPVKIEHFLFSLQEHLEAAESVIVFTQFLSTLGRIERELERMQTPFFTLQGNVSAKERLRLISAFQESQAPAVMLMTLKTGGVGLNLTKASVVYHLEPWWNPAVENQATDRAHRMGQKKDVKVFNLLIEGSLEERITDLKAKKQKSFDRLFSVESVEESPIAETEEGLSSLSREDFLYLLKS